MSILTKKAKSMKVADLKVKAQELGLEAGKLKKIDLIRAIQVAENFTPCFGTSSGQCDQSECCFIGDCLKVK